MTRQASPSRATPTSWIGLKELARRQYERGDYEAALTSYVSALNPDLHCPASEQQIILSNLVACRLKLGGPAQARAAVENAKQCIALNPQWAKGHVRLASAYIALGGHSNDACNELQRALSLDPGNTTARDMLVRELRRDHAGPASASNSASSRSRNSTNNNNNHSSEYNNYGATSSRPPQDAPQQHTAPPPPPPPPPPFEPAMDDSLTWMERCQFHVGRAISWYNRQSDDFKTALKIVVIILILYVGFGGRFGLGGSSRHSNRMEGNYGADNVYNQYRKYGTTTSATSHRQYDDGQTRRQPKSGASSGHRRASSSSSSSSYHHDDDHYQYQNDNNGYYSNSHHQRGGGGGGWSFGGGGGFHPLDGSLQSMLLLGGLVYAGHRMGINPFHTVMMFNMMGGGRHRLARPRGGFWMGRGFGGGMGGMRYPARRRY